MKIGQRYSVIAADGASVTSSWDADSGETYRLPQGARILCAETRPGSDGKLRIRISSPAGWVDAQLLEPASSPKPSKLDSKAFEERHLLIAPGDRYGLDFPIGLKSLEEMGPDFLTAAFRAAGVISPDNSVTAIVEVKKIDLRGASENGLLEVSYAKDEPDLSTKLFVKFPASDVQRKFDLLRSFDGEIEMAWLAEDRELPIRVARPYFADHSAYTSNYILITERIPFGIDPIEPAHRKGYDHLIPDARAHYIVLVKALARLAAAHKTGAIGHDLEERFPFPRAARTFEPIAEPEPKLDVLIDFIGRVAPQLFAPGVSNAQFLARWREDVLFGLAHKDAVIAYLHEDVDYTALCHPNLNIDNAWYWRDETGALQAGLLDWGGAGQMSIAQALSGMLMMPEPEDHLGLVQSAIDTFIAEYAGHGGPLLDGEVLHFHYKASVYSTAIFIFIMILADIIASIPETAFASAKDRNDPGFTETGLRSLVVWIDNMLREWQQELTPGDACRRIVAGTAPRRQG